MLWRVGTTHFISKRQIQLDDSEGEIAIAPNGSLLANHRQAHPYRRTLAYSNDAGETCSIRTHEGCCDGQQLKYTTITSVALFGALLSRVPGASWYAKIDADTLLNVPPAGPQPNLRALAGSMLDALDTLPQRQKLKAALHAQHSALREAGLLKHRL